MYTEEKSDLIFQTEACQRSEKSDKISATTEMEM